LTEDEIEKEQTDKTKDDAEKMPPDSPDKTRAVKK
jgi:hypothetical protein